MIQKESRVPNGGNVYYVTMQITFLTRKFWNVERNLHCDVVHITTVWVSSLTLDWKGVFAIKAFRYKTIATLKCSLLVHSLILNVLESDFNFNVVESAFQEIPGLRSHIVHPTEKTHKMIITQPEHECVIELFLKFVFNNY